MSDPVPVGRYDRHVFVCINQRPEGAPRGCCHSKGGFDLHGRLKALLAERGLQRRIRANRSLCLDVCERGPALVVYPDNVWYAGFGAEDLEEIVERHLVGGEIVERLRVPDSELRADLQG